MAGGSRQVSNINVACLVEAYLSAAAANSIDAAQNRRIFAIFDRMKHAYARCRARARLFLPPRYHAPYAAGRIA